MDSVGTAKSPGQYNRVITYIDGFNLYYGMKQGGLNRFYWLDLRVLALHLLQPPQQKLAGVKYFTARVSNPLDKRKRQSDYLEALETHSGIVPFLGNFHSNDVECFACGHRWPKFEEKMTDVNVATEMLTDAFQGLYDTALLISGDSDLVPPIRAIRKLFPELRVVVAFPPNRYSKNLANTAHGHLFIDEPTLGRSQLPHEVVKPGGFVLKRPPSWAPADPNATP
jgi:uncharacterized LabA/DUF88 family protein